MDKTLNLDQVKAYCVDRISEIRSVFVVSPAFGFVCAASFIEFVSKLYTGIDKDGAGYIEFIENEFPAKYKTFKFISTDMDLAKQIYTVFRCGLLHAFSLTPDEKNRDAKTVRTIVISHNGVYGDKKYTHLQNFTEGKFDAAMLIGEDFCKDIEYSLKFLNGSDALKNVQIRLLKQPPLSSVWDALEPTKTSRPLEDGFGNRVLAE
ncbi:MAG: hypothetical protein AABZ32_09500 [Bacteroidota bacterium]